MKKKCVGDKRAENSPRVDSSTRVRKSPPSLKLPYIRRETEFYRPR